MAPWHFDLALPVQTALREAVERSDAGYPALVPALADALAGFAGDR